MTALDRNSIENNRIPSYGSLVERVRKYVKVANVLSPDALTSWRSEKPKLFKDLIQTLMDYRLMHKYFEERDAMNLLASMFATTTEMQDEDFESQLRQAFGNGFCQLRNSVTPTDKETYIFYYTGHGLSAKSAQQHSSYLKPFITSKDAPDDWIFEKNRKLSGGEIFLHTFGFADLKYILDVWNSALMNKNGRMNKHLIIILDSCYSGLWDEELNKIFKKSYSFLNNNCYITLQTACRRNEKTISGHFTKFFLLFQSNFDFLRRASSEWRDLTQEDKDYYVKCRLPNPQLVSNHPEVKDSEDLFRLVKCEDGNPMYLFSDSGFFKFCVYKADLESYQNSCQLVERAFKREELNQIMESGRVTDYKLKRIRVLHGDCAFMCILRNFRVVKLSTLMLQHVFYQMETVFISKKSLLNLHTLVRKTKVSILVGTVLFQI